MVAENSSVCRRAGSMPAMRRTSRTKPMSSMRSASSSTKASTWSSRRWPCPIRSSRRPGVATRRSTPRRERPDLGRLADAAEDDRALQLEVAAVGRRSDSSIWIASSRVGVRIEHPRRARLRTGAGRVQPLQQRQREGGGLARAGLGDAEQVAALEQLRDGGDLDRRGAVVALLGECAQERRGQPEVGKGWQVFVLSVRARRSRGQGRPGTPVRSRSQEVGEGTER